MTLFVSGADWSWKWGGIAKTMWKQLLAFVGCPSYVFMACRSAHKTILVFYFSMFHLQKKQTSPSSGRNLKLQTYIHHSLILYPTQQLFIDWAPTYYVPITDSDKPLFFSPSCIDHFLQVDHVVWSFGACGLVLTVFGKQSHGRSGFLVQRSNAGISGPHTTCCFGLISNYEKCKQAGEI